LADFEAKAAGVIGLYRHPPQHADAQLNGHYTGLLKILWI